MSFAISFVFAVDWDECDTSSARSILPAGIASPSTFNETGHRREDSQEEVCLPLIHLTYGGDRDISEGNYRFDRFYSRWDQRQTVSLMTTPLLMQVLLFAHRDISRSCVTCCHHLVLDHENDSLPSDRISFSVCSIECSRYVRGSRKSKIKDRFASL